MALGKQSFFLLGVAALITTQFVLFSAPFLEGTLERTGMADLGFVNKSSDAPFASVMMDLQNGLGHSNMLFLLALVLLGAFGSTALRHAVIVAVAIGYSIALASYQMFSNVPKVFSVVAGGMIAASVYLIVQDGIQVSATFTAIKKRNGWASVAFFFRHAFGVMWGLILLFDPERYFTSSPEVAAAYAQPIARQAVQLHGAGLLVACIVGSMCFLRATKREVSAILGVSIFFALHFMNANAYFTHAPVEHESVGIGIFQIALLVLGLAANEGVALVQHGGLFDIRNSLGLIFAANFIVWIAGHSISNPPSLVATFSSTGSLSQTAYDLLQIRHSISLQLVGWFFIVWVFGSDSAVRTTLLASALVAGSSTAYWVGFGSSFWVLPKIFPYLAQSAALIIIALYSLHQNTGGNIFGWLRAEVFQRSYEPARGGLYLAAIGCVGQGIALALDVKPSYAAARAVGGLESFLVQHLAFWAVVVGFGLYLIVRVANDDVLTALTWGYTFWVMSHVCNWTAYSFRSGALFPIADTDLLFTVVMLGGLLSPFALKHFRHNKRA